MLRHRLLAMARETYEPADGWKRRADPCPSCKGQGVFQSLHHDERGHYIEHDDCDHCGGTGWIPARYKVLRRQRRELGLAA